MDSIHDQAVQAVLAKFDRSKAEWLLSVLDKGTVPAHLLPICSSTARAMLVSAVNVTRRIPYTSAMAQAWDDLMRSLVRYWPTWPRLVDGQIWQDCDAEALEKL